MARLLDRSLAELAAGLRSRKYGAAALVEESIAAHDRNGARLDAYKLWQPEAARQAARAADLALAAGADLGPLHGLPVSVKDLFAVSGLPTFAGCPKRLPPSFDVEGPVVAAVRQQEAVIVGKTHTVQFAYGGLGTNSHWGTPRNPWDAVRHRVPGGSSSGAGVSLAEGSAVLALGSDTAGSVRVPASFTGVVGLKTTVGRWPLAGIVPLSPSLDTPGILTRTVADASLAFAAIDSRVGPRPSSGPVRRPDLGGLRLGLSEALFWDDCSPGVAEGVRAALDELVAGGARLVRLDLPGVADAFALFRRGGIASAEFYAFLSSELPEWQATLDPMIAQRFEMAKEISAAEYLGRRKFLARAAAIADERLRAVDALVTPTAPITPPTLEDVSTLEGYREKNMMALRNTTIANLMELCALTMPVALDRAGMPVGLQLMGRRNHDERLVAVGETLERRLGTARERLGAPPLCRDS